MIQYDTCWENLLEGSEDSAALQRLKDKRGTIYEPLNLHNMRLNASTVQTRSLPSGEIGMCFSCTWDVNGPQEENMLLWQCWWWWTTVIKLTRGVGSATAALLGSWTQDLRLVCILRLIRTASMCVMLRSLQTLLAYISFLFWSA